MKRNFWVSNGFGVISRKPFIKFEDLTKKYELMMDVETARKIAGDILEVCEAADQEGFLVQFFMQELKLSEQEVYNLLRKFRLYRQEQIANARRRCTDDHKEGDS